MRMRVAGRMNICALALVIGSAASKAIVSTSIESREVDTEALSCGTEGVTQLSGYFNIQDAGATDKEYFFWFFESQDKPDDDPVVLWLTGGPGCSSTLALMVENGPCTVNEDGRTTTPNAHSWNFRANVLWVDQPAGVGFSFGKAPGDFDHGEDAVGEDMYWFLQSFFDKYDKYSSNKLFVFGESYGGHYAPAVAHRVWQGNTRGDAKHINLAGLGIGNGLTSPSIQYPYYTQMAINNPYGVKAVSGKDADTMRTNTPVCVAMIETCQFMSAICEEAQEFCNRHLVEPYERSGLNPYDVRVPCGDDDLCYDFSRVEKFLRLDSTRRALNVRDESAVWESCNMKVNSDFSGDWMKNFDGYVADLLDNDISVLIYAGDADFICNYLGNEAWTLQLSWTLKDMFNEKDPIEWIPEGSNRSAGLARSYEGFTFLRIYEAGHMVPMDQPEAALAMLNTFIHDDSISFQKPVDASYVSKIS